MTNPGNYEVTRFGDYGVYIAAPAGTRVNWTPLPDNAAPLTPQSNYTPLRIVGNLKFTPPGSSDDFVDFDPPARLQVRHTSQQADWARDAGRSLTLAWWDGREWHPLTLADGRLDPDGDRPAVVVLIHRIKDPPISLGR